MIPESVIQTVLAQAAKEMAKSSGPAQTKHAFYKAMKTALDEAAYAKGADPVEFYAKAMESPELQEAVRGVELKLDEQHRLAVARGGDGRS